MDTEIYFEQLTPLVILSQTAEETGKSVAQVEDETNKSMENPATTDDGQDETSQGAIPPKESNMEEEEFDDINFIRTVGTQSAFFTKEFK